VERLYNVASIAGDFMMRQNEGMRFSLWGMTLAVGMLLAACGGDSSSGVNDDKESSSSLESSSSVWSSSSFTEIESSSSSMPTISYGEITDPRDKQKYKTVVIGTQTWMAQNLNYAVDSSWCYDNSADSCAKYGRLYQWAAAMGLDAEYKTDWDSVYVNRQGVCPEGWRIPNDDDWLTLLYYVEVNNGSEEIDASLKSTSGWYGDVAGTNRFGFSALPAGERNSNGDFYFAGYSADFWSPWSGDEGCYWYLSYNFGTFYEGNELNKYYGNNADKIAAFSVRCIKN